MSHVRSVCRQAPSVDGSSMELPETDGNQNLLWDLQP
jgi:hypothetical protein